ncbi:MAG: tetratricopeptide repeat protein [Proteobacteria bacterium]|nr:tetratricopeptide repeat protein [Pseudomonadota bacterium]
MNTARYSTHRSEPSRAMRMASLILQLLFLTVAAIIIDWFQGGPNNPFAIEERGETIAGDYLSARFAYQMNDADKAEAYLTSALGQDPTNTELLKHSYQLMIASGEYTKAMQLSRRYAALMPEPSLAHLYLAMDAAKRGNIPEMKTILNRLLKQDESKDEPARGNIINRVAIPMLLAWGDVASGEPDKAVERMQAQQKEMMLPFVFYHLALIDDLTGKTKEAEAVFDKLLEQAPPSFRLAEVTSNFYSRIGKPEKAAHARAVYLEINPDSKAEELFLMPNNAPIIANPTQGLAEVLVELGGFFYGLEKYDDALMYLRMGLMLNPELPHAKMLVANTLREEKRYDDAIKVYRTVTTPPAFEWQAKINIARELSNKGDDDAARSMLVTMSEQKPNDLAALLSIGDILLNKKSYEEAEEVYSNAIKRITKPQERYWAIYYARGICYERMDQWENAEKDLNKALELSPDNPDVLNYLAYSWLLKDINFDKAREYLQTAITARPHDAHIIDSYGWALYKLGKYTDALVFIERANLIAPHDPTSNDHLGDVYWKLGRTTEARYQWKRALSYDPPKEELPLIKAKIEHGLEGAETFLAPTGPVKRTANAKPDSDDTQQTP